MQRGTDHDHIAAVVGIEDRVLRNFWVTQTYADLSRALSELLDATTVNWCTFGTWASFTVGGNLRGEALPQWLHEHVTTADGMMGALGETNQLAHHHGVAHLIDELSLHHIETIVKDMFGACALQLSQGNTEVFAEIAPAAAAFLTAFGAPGADRGDARKIVLEATSTATIYEGKNRLDAGFTHWCDAFEATDAAVRSQLILAGSLELGDHEQHHLQGPIESSMAMGLDEVTRRLKDALAKGPHIVAELEADVAKVLAPAARAISDLWLSMMTELLGHIDSPDGASPLNRDVPPLGAGPFTPPELDPITVSDLGDLLKRFNRATPDGKGSAAINWANLDDRMNYITNLFISRHHHTALLVEPFDEATIAAIEADHIPSWVLRPGQVTSFTPAVPMTRARGDAPTVGMAGFTPEKVAALRNFGDDPAEAAVAAFFAATDADHLELFKKIGKSTAFAVADEELPGVGPFLATVDEWPAWVDPELVKVGERVFGQWGPQLGMGLWLASLPADYVLARGTVPLVKTTRLTQAPKRRYLETGQLIITAMTPGALVPGAPGYIAVRHVRLMHAAVRHALLNPNQADTVVSASLGPWDEALGIPINQQELLGCLFSFSVIGLQVLERSGVKLSDRDKEGYIHAWNVVGHLLGIRSDLLPLNVADSTAVWDEICRQEAAKSEGGIELTKAAIECIDEMIRRPMFKGLPASGIRHFLGDHIADMLEVPQADWTRHFFRFVAITDSLWRNTIARIPAVPDLSAMIGRRMLAGFERSQRQGNRPGFEITDELRDAWGLKALTS